MVGVGGFGIRRRETMRLVGLYELVAAFDRSAEAIAKAKAEDSFEVVDSYEKLLAYPGLEAIVISTGATSHAELATQAAHKGLHVFVEKPLCSTPKEMRDLLAVQKETGVVIGMGHNDHANEPLGRTIKKMIDGGELGKIAAFDAITAHSGGCTIKPGDWRGEAGKNPGGMLFQCGVHKFHELMFYFGPIQRVFARMRYDLHTTETADVACVLVEFSSGVMGTLSAYHVTPYRHTTSIFGTQVNLYLDVHVEDGAPLKMQRVAPNYNGSKELPVPVKITEPGDVLGNVRSFYNAIVNGGKLYPSVLDGARAVAAVFAAEESAKTGQPVELPRDLW